MALANIGYMDIEELKSATGYPTEERMKKGPVAIAECIQEIPCNPCEGACKFGAISVGTPITTLPAVNFESCTGCAQCVARCPGLAIFIVDKSYSDTMGKVTFPHEYLPLPEKGQIIKAVDRSGHEICDCMVVKVLNPKGFDKTPVVTIEVPIEFVEHARGIVRHDQQKTLNDDMLVCRCEEVTVGEIKEAIRQGATDVTGVKRRTRAGMGLCQGRTCEKMVQAIIRQELGNDPESISSATPRTPVRPVSFGALGGGE
ncbi:MAG: (2Fe-2S)-binding protein [Lachnospiraceae bacterium]